MRCLSWRIAMHVVYTTLIELSPFYYGIIATSEMKLPLFKCVTTSGEEASWLTTAIKE